MCQFFHQSELGSRPRAFTRENTLEVFLFVSMPDGLCREAPHNKVH